MPKAKPVSLHPLSFEEAIKGLIRVIPAISKTKTARLKIKRKPKPRGK